MYKKLLLLVIAALIISGCATTNSELTSDTFFSKPSGIHIGFGGLKWGMSEKEARNQLGIDQENGVVSIYDANIPEVDNTIVIDGIRYGVHTYSDGESIIRLSLGPKLGKNYKPKRFYNKYVKQLELVFEEKGVERLYLSDFGHMKITSWKFSNTVVTLMYYFNTKREQIASLNFLQIIGPGKSISVSALELEEMEKGTRKIVWWAGLPIIILKRTDEQIELARLNARNPGEGITYSRTYLQAVTAMQYPMMPYNDFLNTELRSIRPMFGVYFLDSPATYCSTWINDVADVGTFKIQVKSNEIIGLYNACRKTAYDTAGRVLNLRSTAMPLLIPAYYFNQEGDLIIGVYPK